MIKLTTHEKQLVKSILTKHLPHCTVWAFGSRVTGKAHPYSDLDLVVIGQTALAWQDIAALKTAFSESSLPFMVDVVDWHAISTEFQEIIQQHYVVMQLAQ